MLRSTTGATNEMIFLQTLLPQPGATSDDNNVSRRITFIPLRALTSHQHFPYCTLAEDHQNKSHRGLLYVYKEFESVKNLLILETLYCISATNSEVFQINTRALDMRSRKTTIPYCKATT